MTATIHPFPSSDAVSTAESQAFALVRALERAGEMLRFDGKVAEEIVTQLDAAIAASDAGMAEAIIGLADENAAFALLVIQAMSQIDQHRLPSVEELLRKVG